MKTVVIANELSEYSGNVSWQAPSVTVHDVVTRVVYSTVTTVTSGTLPVVHTDDRNRRCNVTNVETTRTVTAKTALPCSFTVATYARPLRPLLDLTLCRPPMYSIVIVINFVVELLNSLLGATALDKVNTAL